jgi:hypothetical protein
MFDSRAPRRSRFEYKQIESNSKRENYVEEFHNKCSS